MLAHIATLRSEVGMAEKTEKFAWSDDLSVGHKKLDAQHKGLIKLINAFGQDAMSQMEMGKRLEGLIAYAARHFNDEESFIMRKAPGLLTHQIESHATFIEKAYDFAHRFNEGAGDDLRQEVYGFLCDWLAHHIREEDQLYNPSRKAIPA